MKIDYTDVERPMTKADKSLWVEVLRSGNYEQGKEYLFNKRTQKYCCLGVAADIFNLKSTSTGTLAVGSHSTIPLFLPSYQQIALYQLNDDDGATFPEIADFIETNIKAVDE